VKFTLKLTVNHIGVQTVEDRIVMRNMATAIGVITIVALGLVAVSITIGSL
jgi:hypothetical protein